MPVDPNAPVRISAFHRVPDFAKGYVRDLRVRWALEEAGIPYSVRTLDAMAERPSDYLLEQPFGQVPSYRDDNVEMFESGAIVLHIAEQSEALMPRDAQGRAKARTWVVAALNTIEPVLSQLLMIDLFNKDAPWAAEARPRAAEMVAKRLDQLAAHLGDRDWLEDRFTCGDLVMSAALRMIDYSDLLETRPPLVAFKARCEGRPAFQRALAAQMADFRDEPIAAE